MSAMAVAMLAGFLVVLVMLAHPLGLALAHIAGAARLPGAAGALERSLLRAAGVSPEEDMPWRRYAAALLLFNVLGTLLAYLIQRSQAWLPLNPDGMSGVPPDLALDTAVSFVTNTNWQAYAGESTMSYLSQMAAFTVQNFASAATGLAVAFALIRGFARRTAQGVGNFWVDLIRGTIFVLLPLSVVMAVLLMGQGVVQTLGGHAEARLLDPVAYDQPRLDPAGNAMRAADGTALTDPRIAATQSIALGPVASQEAIKMLGTNGGGFFNANSAHPFENPTPLSNYLEMVAMLLIPAALCFAFGRLVGDTRQGWAVFCAMTLIFAGMAAADITAESYGNPRLQAALQAAAAPVDDPGRAAAASSSVGPGAASASGGTRASERIDVAHGVLQAGGNMEGKETRFGILGSALFATATTAASCGAVNAMHDSFMPLGGLVPLWLMQLGEVVYGGVGAGLYGMLIFAILAVFVAGLMIGRTPEYLGKKVEAFEMKMTSIVILVTPFLVLVGSACAVLLPAGKAGIANPGPHGFTEILYAFSSAANNNGSAFGGLSVNTPFYNLALATAMWFGRFAFIIPVLAIAGSLAAKKRIEATVGTLPTHGPLFVVLLVGTVVLVGALTYVPALALGPAIEHLQLWSGAAAR